MGEHKAAVITEAEFFSPTPADPIEQIGLALGELMCADDLGQAFDAVARRLALSVGAHTALVAATGVAANGASTLASGPPEVDAALVLALHPESAQPGDVVIRFVSGEDVGLASGGRWCGMSTRFSDDTSTGVVLAVFPSCGDGAESAGFASTINTFAEMARLCVVRADEASRRAEPGGTRSA
jgi:hypothetical protein